MHFHIAWLSLCAGLASTLVAVTITKPGCRSQCGNLTVPYPFGIGQLCGLEPWFELNCDTSFNPPKPLLRNNLTVYDISDSQLRISTNMAVKCYGKHGEHWFNNPTPIDFIGSPYILSVLNKLTVIGCDDFALLMADSDQRNFISGCISTCSKPEDVLNRSCSGIGCCQSSVPNGLKFLYTSLRSLNNHSTIWSINQCSHAFFGEASRFTFRGTEDLSDLNFRDRTLATVPVVLDWAISNRSCVVAQKFSDNFACQNHSFCVDSDSGLGGYRCRCDEGYEGNPYLSPGCQDIDECANPNLHDCLTEEMCINTQGSYNCSCPDGYHGDARKSASGCMAMESRLPAIRFSLGIGFGFLSILIGIVLLYLIIRRRQLIKLKKKFFQQNGGLLLRQHLSSHKGGELIRVFSIEELKKATNKFSKERILGRGGYGTVYKGILSQNQIVAIKKSIVMDEHQVEQFINEIIILAQINHRNVVKLLGCCLDTEVPLLVYEFVSRGNLYDHIHNTADVVISWLSWENRLRIANEMAIALSYLHSEASMSIIHRDIKSANILLDDNYTAKISDFGASRLVPLDQTRVATIVQGTLGYLDPEYFYTGELTEKSDVYSFGVILAELMTGMEPILIENEDKKFNLSTLFIEAMEKNQLFQNLEPRVLKEGTLDQLQMVAMLVKRCLSLKGKDRPTTKEVAVELEELRKMTKKQWRIHEKNNGEETMALINSCEFEGTSDLYNIQSISSNHCGN